MNVNFVSLLEDVKSNNKFLEVFPDLKDKILEYKAKPNCGSCRSVVRQILTSGRLTEIYGADIQVDTQTPMRGTPTPNPKLTKMTLEEFEIYMATRRGKPGVPTFTYVPELKQMWVVTMEFAEPVVGQIGTPGIPIAGQMMGPMGPK